MTFFPDLTPYLYSTPRESLDLPVLNVGWLDAAHPFPVKETPQEFKDRLYLFCRAEYLINLMRGWHECNLCTPTRMAKIVRGNGEIRVMGEKSIFAAPMLIYHYVNAHRYSPPPPFIEAILTGPQPGSERHKKLLQICEFSRGESGAV